MAGILILRLFQVRPPRFWLDLFETRSRLHKSNSNQKSFLSPQIPHTFSLLNLTTKMTIVWASLVAQWLRIRLPMQGTRVRALVWEDPTCHGATKPVHHNYCTSALEPVSHNYWAHVSQLLKPACLEPVLHNKRSHCNEKPAHHNEE